ncbi:uncharacterized protein [Nicotiana tomentosiformis]|uniref:uncharacterized protein isoform X2 n=1 Tax=Nicotiana tomentosiformis TaxID=4098 RepID=UPI00388C3B36
MKSIGDLEEKTFGDTWRQKSLRLLLLLRFTKLVFYKFKVHICLAALHSQRCGQCGDLGVVFYFIFLVDAHALVTPGSGMIMGCSVLKLENIVIYSVNLSFTS